jgi:hypothetical protein
VKIEHAGLSSWFENAHGLDLPMILTQADANHRHWTAESGSAFSLASENFNPSSSRTAC